MSFFSLPSFAGGAPGEEDDDDDVSRLFTISDIHVDDASNMHWLESLPARPRDSLILAGDVSDRLELVERAFVAAKAKYDKVFFTFGNHDVWLREGEQGTSLDKIEAVFEVAKKTGVETGVCTLGKKRKCVVAPLQSFYHASFDTEDAITRWRGIPSAKLVMTDFRRCRWPKELAENDELLAKTIDERNDGIEAEIMKMKEENVDVITFSHFLPRIELLPEKRYLFLPTLMEAVGSRFLGERVKRIKPDLHIFGHTHINWDMTIDGTRYIQAALAYPNEWRTRPASLAIGQLASADDRQPLLVWDSKQGIVKHDYPTRWSDHYKAYPRVPELTHVLPPYTARLYKPLPGSAVKDVKDHVKPKKQKEQYLRS